MCPNFQTTEEITKLMPEDFNKKLKEWEQIKEGKPSPRSEPNVKVWKWKCESVTVKVWKCESGSRSKRANPVPGQCSTLLYPVFRLIGWWSIRRWSILRLRRASRVPGQCSSLLNTEIIKEGKPSPRSMWERAKPFVLLWRGTCMSFLFKIRFMFIFIYNFLHNMKSNFPINDNFRSERASTGSTEKKVKLIQ